MPDLRVHRARVDRAFGDGFLNAVAEVALRIGKEFAPAARGAEIVGAASIVGAVLCGMRIDIHAADGVFDCGASGRCGFSAGVVAVVVA